MGAALVALTGRDAPVERKITRYGEVLRSGWKLYRLAFFYFITFGGFVAMFLLLPTVLQDWFKVQPEKVLGASYEPIPFLKA